MDEDDWSEWLTSPRTRADAALWLSVVSTILSLVAVAVSFWPKW